MRRLGRRFFTRPAPEVAPDLVGKLLVRDDGTTPRVVARLVEVEAYTEDEPACHAHRGMTPRNAPLFAAGGHSYVYFTYGMHWCLNTSSGEPGHGQGCLLRAAEPLDGLEVMRARRGPVRERDLLRGPARLAQAYGLDGTWSGLDLTKPGPLWIADDGDRSAVVATPRTGVTLAADLLWRFEAQDSPWVLPYKRHPRAPR